MVVALLYDLCVVPLIMSSVSLNVTGGGDGEGMMLSDMKPTPSVSEVNGITTDPSHQSSVALLTSPVTSQNTVIMREFCQHTTAHGWGHLELQTRRSLRLLWLCLILTVYALAAMHVSVLVLQYFDYPSEQISRIQVESLKFPSVTLCNIIPVSLTAAGKLMRDNGSEFFRWNNFTKALVERERVILEAGGKSSKLRRLLFSRLQHPTAFYENTGEEAVQVGHRLDDFVIRCSFGYEECNISESFVLFRSPTYYNCYTFNSLVSGNESNTSRPQIDAKATGPQQGLSIILYLENDNADDLLESTTYHTISNVGNAAGVRVIVHEYGTLPFPVDEGIDIPPGFSTSLGMRVTKYVRLPQPYGECKAETGQLNVVRRGESHTTYAYSTHACMALCQQRYIANKCQCVSSLMPVSPEYAALKYCGYFNESDTEFYFSNLSCEAERIVEFSKNDSLRKHCHCLPSCKEYSYSIDSSYAYWPLELSQQSFFNTIINAHPQRDRLKAYYQFQATNDTGFVRRNFVRVNVYFKDMMLEEMEQKRSYEVQNLFSDIGGTCGLWVGISVLSYCEVVELVCTLVASLCARMKHSRSMIVRQKPV